VTLPCFLPKLDQDNLNPDDDNKTLINYETWGLMV